MSAKLLKNVKQKFNENPVITSKTVLVLLATAFMFFMHFAIELQNGLELKCYGTKNRYICEGDKFKFDYVHYVIINFSFAILAKICMIIKSHLPNVKEKEKDKTSLWWYAAIALSLVVSTVANKLTLYAYSYTGSAISTALKPLFAMFGCLLIAKIRFKMQRYVFVILIGVGWILIYSHLKDGSGVVFGYIFSVISLVSIAAMYGILEKVRLSTKPTALDLMFWINLMAAPMLLVPMLVNRELLTFLYFVWDHPEVLSELAEIGIFLCLATFIDYFIVVNYGAVSAAIMSSTWLFFNLIIREFITKNPGQSINFRTEDILGGSCIAVGLLADLIFNEWSCQRCENMQNRTIELENLNENKIQEPKEVV